MSNASATPPMALEQWLSLVIALPSHRSSNEGHRAFGTRLMKLIYDDLPAQFAEDATARAYLNNMLVEVGWAVRGFSAVRDNFQRGVQASTLVSEHRKERAKGWAELSPLKKESLGAKGLSLIVGAGGATALNRAFPSLPVGWNVAIVIVLAYAVHLFLDWLQSSAVKRALKGEPAEVMENWNSDARPRYVAIARTFLEKAAMIEQQFYPRDDTDTTPDFDALIERAFAFGNS